jgi:hypothetical protein
MAQPEKWEAPVALPYARTMKALKLFPCIGDPGAEKILLFRGVVDCHWNPTVCAY